MCVFNYTFAIAIHAGFLTFSADTTEMWSRIGVAGEIRRSVSTLVTVKPMEYVARNALVAEKNAMFAMQNVLRQKSSAYDRSDPSV